VNWPAGFASAGAACGIKSSGDDVAVLIANKPVRWAGTFTRNAAAAASVHWCRSLMGGEVRAIVCNSGNANACTGTDGERAVREVVVAASEAIGCDPREVLIASTGPIGVRLPAELITAALPTLTSEVTSSVEGFAQAILTTDSAVKVAVAEAGDAVVVGVAKGAAMLAPNMATMLAFLATDASSDDLQGILSEAVSESFDRISVDACESTNDSVFLLAGGAVPAPAGALQPAITSVCKQLAEMMVRDAEGGSKFVRIQVYGATDDRAAVELGRAVAASALWRAAVNGGDPNWGRVLAALGSADRALDISQVTIALGPETVFDKGQPSGDMDAARKVMAADEITVSCSVGDGVGVAEVLTSDLTTDYVTLNATGST
jgi:glutamate N-acetyltransferase / amino-acid N-acetyltransferase